MARKLQLKKVALNSGLEGEFDYGFHLLQMLRFEDHGRLGMTFDDIVKRTEALAPIQKAIADKADEVTLSDEQWRTVRDKFERYQFHVADQAFVDFGLMIRNSEEIGT